VLLIEHLLRCGQIDGERAHPSDSVFLASKSSSRHSGGRFNMRMLEVGGIVELRRILRGKALERSAGNLIRTATVPRMGPWAQLPAGLVVSLVVRSVISCLLVVSRNIAAFIGCRAQLCVGLY
jgi:hypothetical protein